MKYTVVRDVQEKANFWHFGKASTCGGTIVESLKTGDYTLRGLEKIFIVERKHSSGELAGNLTKKQFTRELERMQQFKHAYCVCEFLLEDLFNFPYNSGIPRYVWPKLRVSSNFLLKKLFELECKYSCKFIFAGFRGKEVAKLLFKQMVVLYPNEIT